MSANPLDVELSHGHTRIAQSELSRQSVRLALLRNLNKHISNHDSTVLLHRKIGTGKERSLRNWVLAQEPLWTRLAFTPREET
jgi:hypothetical protein